MPTDLEIILKNLEDNLNQTRYIVRPPFFYLDYEAVDDLFHDVTGWCDRPRLRYQLDQEEGGGRIDVITDPARGGQVPAAALFEAMEPVLWSKIPLVEKAEGLNGLAYRYARVRGILQSTHFPDGNLNLEITFAGVRGVLFYTPSNFASLVRPMLVANNFHSICTPVDALFFVHGCLQRTIFYHQTYGDNREHDWLPLVPVVIREDTAAVDSRGGCFTRPDRVREDG